MIMIELIKSLDRLVGLHKVISLLEFLVYQNPMLKVVLACLASQPSLIHVGEYDRYVFTLYVCDHIHILIPRSMWARCALRYQNLFDLGEVDLRVEYDPIDLLLAPLDQHTHIDHFQVDRCHAECLQSRLLLAHQVHTPLVHPLDHLVYFLHWRVLRKVLTQNLSSVVEIFVIFWCSFGLGFRRSFDFLFRFSIV